MRQPRHTANALRVRGQLDRWGLSPLILEGIGAFAVAWGLFESTLECAVWALQHEQVNGVHPSTDRSQVGEWIKVLGLGRSDLSIAANEVLAIGSQGAADLAHYRNSLMHGSLVPLGGAAFFIRNPSWHGEVRKRPVGDAHIDENLLDMAIDAAWILFRLAQVVSKLPLEQPDPEPTEALDPEVRRAGSSASELRHLAALMNHEKY